MPQQMVLGPWHEIWEAFLYYVSKQAAEHDRSTHNDQLWPEWMQRGWQGKYKIFVDFAKTEANISCFSGTWSSGFEDNPHHVSVFEQL
jgi:hypothetical protein